MVIDFVAVLAAAIAGWLVGAVWYGVLGKQWMAALGAHAPGLNDPSGKRRIPIGPMVLSFFALLLMAYLLSGIILHVGAPSLRIGVISGALVWLGFTIPAITVNNAFQRQKPMLTIIDGLHWLLVLVAQGAVIGLLG